MFQIEESAKTSKFLFSRVILIILHLYTIIYKGPNNITFLYVSKHRERLLEKLSKNKDLLWSEGLYAPTINHFLEQRFISRKLVSQ